MTQYVGILEGDGQVWSIRVPDVPGCHGGGDSPEAALADTISALREVAAIMAGDGVALRPPRAVTAIMADPEAAYDPAAGESLVMVPLLLDKGRSVKANISLDAGLLEQIDAEARRRGITRSAFLASAAIEQIMHGTRPG